MTQMLNTITPMITPVTTDQITYAADVWADIQTPEGRTVYPGCKLRFLITDRGLTAATAYVNQRAREMTVRPLYQVIDVERAVANLERLVEAGEYQAAEQAERDIWEGVLEAVASGNAQSGYLAAEALKTKDLDFPRS
jgi:hypothetical protein